ncbi:hypothetical protein B0E43_03495 [Algoriphagus sp. A40]|nr:hypothetical protein B0E43_03495 [Algoriphagus sp. A40]
MKPTRFVLALAALFWTFCLMAQTDTSIPLNKHYFEIYPEDSVNHVFNKLVSYSKDSTKLERIFTRDGKIQRVVMTKPPTKEYHEQVTDQYNAYNELEWRRTENLLNSKFLTLYYFDNKKVGEILSESDTLFFVARNGETKPIQQSVNDFEPMIGGSKEDWSEFFAANIKLSAKLYSKEPAEYWIAVLVNEYGIVNQVEWANHLGGNQKIASQLIRVLELWGNNFSPALDPFGHPVTKWLLIPFRMRGGISRSLKVLDIDSF